jgi:hypothetical protein
MIYTIQGENSKPRLIFQANLTIWLQLLPTSDAPHDE